MQIDASEYAFKLALAERRYDAVLAMARSGRLCGQAIIAYLQEKGYPEVALHFVRDERLRFDLAVACGNLEAALAAAQALDDAGTWGRLGAEALRQGNLGAVEFALQRTRAYERLSFLYLATGDRPKLAKMLKLAGVRGDTGAAFQTALLLGDARERARLLAEAGQPALAYLTAATHGLAEEAERLREGLGDAAPAPPAPGAATLLLPPSPVLSGGNWPLLTVSKGFFEALAAKDAERAKSGAGAAAAAAALEAVDLSAAGGAWGDEGDEDLGLGGAGAGAGAGGGDWGSEGGEEGGAAGAEGGEGGGGGSDGGWELEDLDLPPEPAGGGAAAADGAAGAAADLFAAPAPGAPAEHRWATRCAHAAELAAAGAFEPALRQLARQIGAVEFGPLRPYLLEVHAAAAAAAPGLPGLPPLVLALDRGWDPDAPRQEAAAPAAPFSVAQLEAQLKAAYRLVTEGKFADALRGFNAILHVVPLLVAASRAEADEVKELLAIARDYSIGLRCELARRELAKDDPKRAAELAAYFTHCALQRVHLALALRAAMTTFFKMRNLATCATFARRLLELQPDEKLAAQARQVLAACERAPVDEAPVEYDPRNPFDLCSITWTPIYRGNKFVECPYSGARFQPACAGQLSPVGGIARVGADATGLSPLPAGAGGGK